MNKMANTITRKLKELTLRDNVVTGITGNTLRHTDIPFTDFYVSQNGMTIEKISNFSVNNVYPEYQEVYGQVKPEYYDLTIVIPEDVDEQCGFNEFYFNFGVQCVCGLPLHVRFCAGSTSKEITSLRTVIDANRTYHFYEDEAGNYTVNFGNNVNGWTL